MKACIAVMGAGGKTTAVRSLAHRLSGFSVLWTTTTHIYPAAPGDCRLLLRAPAPDTLTAALREPGIVCAGTPAGEKLTALSPAAWVAACKAADYIVCEADGAHRLPLKLHRTDEPVLPAETTHVLIVLGLSALGRPVGEVFRQKGGGNPFPPPPPRPAAMIIGLTLAGNALSDAIPAATEGATTETVTRATTGFLGQLPLLLGVLTGSVVAGIFFATGTNLFREAPAAALDASLWKLGDGSIFAVPAFSLPKVSWTAVAAIMPIAIATIPESTAHMYQLDIYVNDVAKRKGSKKKYDLIGLLDRNLIGDGICDMISGVVGGPAGTNYGENISTMAITKVFSVPVLAVAAVIAMIVSFFTPLIRVIYGIPLAVIGGLEVYLFGAIAAQGIAIMIEKKVDMFSSKNIAVIASIMVIGIGGQYAFGGNIPFFGLQVPCIAGAAIFGIVLNLLLSIGEKKAKAEKE